MAIAPIPNSTALTIMLNNSDIENLVDIAPPSNSVPISGQLVNATLLIMFPRGAGCRQRRGGQRTLPCRSCLADARRQALQARFHVGTGLVPGGYYPGLEFDLCQQPIGKDSDPS